MNKEKFIERRPYLYHLTDTENWKYIDHKRILYSTQNLANQVLSDEESLDFIQTRREFHKILTIKGNEISIRDQRPISEKVLARSLTPGWDVKQFIVCLNSRVFFWPTLARLKKHFIRYKDENPTILRCKTEDIIYGNKEIELARLNTGATRCSHFYGGNAPTRGEGTFLNFDQINYTISEVAEFTIRDSCNLPEQFWISKNPDGPWDIVD